VGPPPLKPRIARLSHVCSKHDAQGWARRTEGEMVRGRVHTSQRLRTHDLGNGAETRPQLNQPDQEAGHRCAEAQQLISRLGTYSMATLCAEIIAG
tara:strand:- start:250 stop:537 length:288 start_codon:yes stop_codon:yes gene_type:complete